MLTSCHAALAAGQAAQPLARPRLHPPLLPPALSRLPPVRARAAGRAGWLRALRAAASAADGVNGGGDARNSSGSSSSDGEAQDGRPRTTRRRRRNAEPRQQPEQQQQHGPELDPALQRWLQPAQAVGAPGEAERMPRALRRGRHLAAAMDESEAELMEGYFAHLRQRLALQGAQVRQQLAAVVSPILSNEQSAHGTRAAPQAQPDLLPPHGARERQRRERRRREEYRWRSRTPWYEGPVGDDDAAATVGSHSWDEEGDWQLIVPTASSSSSSGAGGGGSSSSNSSGGGSGGGGQAREREWERGAHAAAWKAAADRHPAALSTMSVDAEDMGAAIAHTFPVDGSLPSAPAPLPSRRTQRRNAQLGGRMINVLVVSAALLNKRNEARACCACCARHACVSIAGGALAAVEGRAGRGSGLAQLGAPAHPARQRAPAGHACCRVLPARLADPAACSRLLPPAQPWPARRCSCPTGPPAGARPSSEACTSSQVGSDRGAGMQGYRDPHGSRAAAAAAAAAAFVALALVLMVKASNRERAAAHTPHAGGKVERNETPQVALRRELAEELGVEVRGWVGWQTCGGLRRRRRACWPASPACPPPSGLAVTGLTPLLAAAPPRCAPQVELDALQALTFVSHRYRFWSHNFLALLFGAPRRPWRARRLWCPTAGLGAARWQGGHGAQHGRQVC